MTNLTLYILQVLAATGGGDATGIAVGNDLIVFERDKDEPSRMVHFSDPIDFMVWRRSILLVGLSSSEIILVDPNTFNFKYSRSVLSMRLRFPCNYILYMI